VVGAVLTNCNVRRMITDQVRAEVSKLFPILGLVRTDAQLLYATTEGRLLEPGRSAAFQDYTEVAKQLQKLLQLQHVEAVV
jgi:hypothetical protein